MPIRSLYTAALSCCINTFVSARTRNCTPLSFHGLCDATASGGAAMLPGLAKSSVSQKAEQRTWSVSNSQPETRWLFGKVWLLFEKCEQIMIFGDINRRKSIFSIIIDIGWSKKKINFFDHVRPATLASLTTLVSTDYGLFFLYVICILVFQWRNAVAVHWGSVSASHDRVDNNNIIVLYSGTKNLSHTFFNVDGVNLLHVFVFPVNILSILTLPTHTSCGARQSKFT